MEDSPDSRPVAKPPLTGGRRLPGRTPSGLLGKPGTLQLNQSTTPQQQALPVKRRGSFQQLKKAGSHVGRDGASSHLDSDSSPSIFAVVKKSTHWEKYGTVLVLVVADELSSDKEAVLQMLSAEGYDDNTTDNVSEALKLFAEKEVYPDIVIIDSDNELVDTRQLIKLLQGLNPTVAVLVLGSRGGPLSAVQALQAGAADYMAKPLDLDEVVARVERHVQRQHCIKLEMEKALEDTKQMMQQLMPASLLGDVMLRKDGGVPGAGPTGGPPGKPGAGGPHHPLNSVAETDFEDQMSELSEENHRLGQKVQEMERKLELKDEENRALEVKLNAIDLRVAALASASSSEGPAGLQIRGQLDSVTRANLDLRHKVDELERLVLHSQSQSQLQLPTGCGGPGGCGGGPGGCGGQGAAAAAVAAAAPAAPQPPLPISSALLASTAAGATAVVSGARTGAVGDALVGVGVGKSEAEEPPPAPTAPPPQQHQPSALRESSGGVALVVAVAAGVGVIGVGDGADGEDLVSSTGGDSGVDVSSSGSAACGGRSSASSGGSGRRLRAPASSSFAAQATASAGDSGRAGVSTPAGQESDPVVASGAASGAARGGDGTAGTAVLGATGGGGGGGEGRAGLQEAATVAASGR